MTLSTHVLDVARGLPAAGISIALYALAGETRTIIARAVTNPDGRTDAPIAGNLSAGPYELIFSVAPYFAANGVAAFYADIPIRFTLPADGTHYHLPLLLAPWGYSTYRGS